MTSKAKRRREAKAAAADPAKARDGELESLRRRITDVERENAGLMDVMNAVLAANDGKIVVPRMRVVSTVRKRIVVTPPRPDHDYYVIEHEGERKPEDTASRLRALGMDPA